MGDLARLLVLIHTVVACWEARFTQGSEQGGSCTEVTRFLMPCNEEILCCDYTAVYYSHSILYSL